MSSTSLLSTLTVASNALEAYNQALSVVQNNVSNANTPGYAAQTQTLDAMMFNPREGFAGGVKAGAVLSSRDEFLEEALRQQTVLNGAANQNVASLTSLQNIFDISGNTGIPYALNNLYSAFTAWSQSPTDSNTQQTVINQASNLATAFQQTASALSGVRQDTEQQIESTVTAVNQLVGQLQQYNVELTNGDRNDPSVDAGIHSTLDQLSQYVSVTASFEPSGAVNLLMNGQTPLLEGNQQFSIGYSLTQPTGPGVVNPSAPGVATITDSYGTDITSDTTTGQLGALLNIHNTVLPSYLGSAYQNGSLNDMAAQFATRVNQLMTSGNISDGPPPVTGSPLFTYDVTNNTDVAATLAVNPTVTAGQLPPIDPGPPEVSNGIPLELSQLADPQTAADEINGESYTEFYGDMAANVGGQLQAATNEQQVTNSSVAQAQNLLQQQSGVNLDEEAAVMVQFQQAYEANSKMVSTLDEITSDVINMVPLTTA